MTRSKYRPKVGFPRLLHTSFGAFKTASFSNKRRTINLLCYYAIERGSEGEGKEVKNGVCAEGEIGIVLHGRCSGVVCRSLYPPQGLQDCAAIIYSAGRHIENSYQLLFFLLNCVSCYVRIFFAEIYVVFNIFVFCFFCPIMSFARPNHWKNSWAVIRLPSYAFWNFGWKEGEGDARNKLIWCR